MKNTKTNKEEKVILKSIEKKELEAIIVGDSELIQHRKSEKLQEYLETKQQKKSSAGQKPRNPEEEWEDCLYKLENGKYGHPSIAFKKAMVAAANDIDMEMKKTKRWFHIKDEYVVLKNPTGYKKRKDNVVIPTGKKANIAYRIGWPDWWCILKIIFNANKISPEQIFTLLNAAGFGVGIGCHRPEKDGTFGRFHVATDEEYKYYMNIINNENEP